METTTPVLSKEDFYNRIFSANGMEEKREILKQLSETAKMMMELDPEAGERVNDIILEKMYTGEEHFEFNTFKGWKEQGKMVKKGSKAFFIWSKPRKVQKEEEPNSSSKEDEKQSYKMYGIAHLFSNAQVEPLTPKA